MGDRFDCVIVVEKIDSGLSCDPEWGKEMSEDDVVVT